MSDDINIEVTEEDGVLYFRAERQVLFRSLGGGEPNEAPMKIAGGKLPAEEELVKDIGYALLGWHAEQQSTGPPGQKPIHQQMDEAYDR